MKDNGIKNNCPFTDEIVSYMYDEIHGVKRANFETHLADCMVCTDDFAAISNARFSVFEWHKEEFVPLATPEIVIPYAPTKAVVEQSGSLGVMAGIRGWLTLVNFPVTVAAALAVTFGLGFFVMTYLDRGEPGIALNTTLPEVVPPDNKTVISTPEIPAPVATKAIESGVTASSKELTSSHEIRAVKAVATRRTKLERQMTAVNNIQVQEPEVKLRKAPKLSGYDDNDDNSLRLADLFDEDGG